MITLKVENRELISDVEITRIYPKLKAITWHTYIIEDKDVLVVPHKLFKAYQGVKEWENMLKNKTL